MAFETKREKEIKNEREFNKQNMDANCDPISGEPGAHPIGTGIGALGGAYVGAAIGTAAGPIGTATGAVVGAVAGTIAGGLTGSAIAEMLNPTEIEDYWRGNFDTRPYARDYDYETFRPAYRYGYESRIKYPENDFGAVESDLERNWAKARGQSNLEWNEARPAVLDAYNYTDEEYKRKLKERI